MLSRFILPKPVSGDDHVFEDLVCEVMARRLGCRNLQRFGRRGQRQYGVDIAGFTSDGRLIGIQCKHHPRTQITNSEIDHEVGESEKFKPELEALYVVTSADRDAVAYAHVLEVSRERERQGHYPVDIAFWDELVGWLVGYPDLVYKYFSQFFPSSELEDIHLSLNSITSRETVSWPVQLRDLEDTVSRTLNAVPKVTPYRLALGVSSFSDVQFLGKVDVDVQLGHLFSDELSAERNFERAASELANLKQVVSDAFFDRELWVFLNARLSLAFLFGWVFRRVAGGFSLKLIHGEQVWATNGLPTVATELTEGLSELLDPSSPEVVVILNISREIDGTVRQFVSTWTEAPHSIRVWELPNLVVGSAAHALSLAQEISYKLKSLMDRGRVTQVHLFCAMPAALATLVGYHLNAIKPITIYFLDHTRQHYLAGGTISNSLSRT